MAKKWKLPFNELRKWATGRTIYVQHYNTFNGHYYYTAITFEEVLRLIEDGETIEFIGGNEDVGDIPRVCLEELVLNDESYDREYALRYYTEQGLKNNAIEL